MRNFEGPAIILVVAMLGAAFASMLAPRHPRPCQPTDFWSCGEVRSAAR